LVFISEGVGIGLSGLFFGLCFGIFLSANVNQLFSMTESAVNAAINLANAIAAPASKGGDFALFLSCVFLHRGSAREDLFHRSLPQLLSGALSAVVAAWPLRGRSLSSSPRRSFDMNDATIVSLAGVGKTFVTERKVSRS
jgi:ABC-type lipoprotein release transport system permease subunit